MPFISLESQTNEMNVCIDGNSLVFANVYADGINSNGCAKTIFIFEMIFWNITSGTPRRTINHISFKTKQNKKSFDRASLATGKR